MLERQVKKRQRLPTSCSVCRARKTKCDKNRPVCSSCIKGNILPNCFYYVPQWVCSTVGKDDQKVVTFANNNNIVHQVSGVTVTKPFESSQRYKKAKNTTSTNKSATYSPSNNIATNADGNYEPVISPRIPLPNNEQSVIGGSFNILSTSQGKGILPRSQLLTQIKPPNESLSSLGGSPEEVGNITSSETNSGKKRASDTLASQSEQQLQNQLSFLQLRVRQLENELALEKQKNRINPVNDEKYGSQVPRPSALPTAYSSPMAQFQFMTGQSPVISDTEYADIANNYYPRNFKRHSVMDLKVLAHYAMVFRDRFLGNFYVKFMYDYTTIKYLISSMCNNRAANLKKKNWHNQQDGRNELKEEDVEKVNAYGYQLSPIQQMTAEQRQQFKNVMLKVAKKNEFATLIANLLKTNGYPKDKRLQVRCDTAAWDFLASSRNVVNKTVIFNPIFNNQFCPTDRLFTNSHNVLMDTIIRTLPRIQIMRYLWKMYALYVYPFIPIFDLRKMADEVSCILVGLKLEEVYDELPSSVDESEKIKEIKIRNKLDYGRLAVFLICMRFAFLAIKSNINEIIVRCDIEEELVGTRSLAEKNDPIPVQLVELASMCLNYLKVSKKASVVSIVATILLYHYAELREEGRVGFGLIQNHLMLSSIINQARHIGLNRDPKNEEILKSFQSLTVHVRASNHFKDTEEDIYYHRKLWHYLMILEYRSSIYHGKPLDITSEEQYNTKFPTTGTSGAKIFKLSFPKIRMIPAYVKGVNHEESEICFQKVEALTLRNMKLECNVNKIFMKVSNMVNNLKTPVQLTKVVEMISQIDQLLMTDELKEENFLDYNRGKIFENDKERMRVTVGENYYKMVSFLQTMPIFYNLKLCSGILSSILFLHYDQIKDSIHGVNNCLYFLKRSFTTSFSIITLSKEFLRNNEDKLLILKDFSKVEENELLGRCYGFKNFNFIILPIIDTMCYRAILIVETLLLRFAHCSSIIDSIIKKMQTSPFLLVTISIEEYCQKRDIFQQMYRDLYGFYYKFVKLLMEKIAKFYSHTFKAMLVYQYYLTCFRTPYNIIKWFDTKSENFDQTNNFINLSLSDLMELKTFVGARLKFDEEKYPDSIPPGLLVNAFSQSKESAAGTLENDSSNFVVPVLKNAFEKHNKLDERNRSLQSRSELLNSQPLSSSASASSSSSSGTTTATILSQTDPIINNSYSSIDTSHPQMSPSQKNSPDSTNIQMAEHEPHDVGSENLLHGNFPGNGISGMNGEHVVPPMFDFMMTNSLDMGAANDFLKLMEEFFGEPIFDVVNRNAQNSKGDVNIGSTSNNTQNQETPSYRSTENQLADNFQNMMGSDSDADFSFYNIDLDCFLPSANLFVPMTQSHQPPLPPSPFFGPANCGQGPFGEPLHVVGNGQGRFPMALNMMPGNPGFCQHPPAPR